MTFAKWFEANIHKYGQADYDKDGYREVAEAAWNASRITPSETPLRENELLTAVLNQARETLLVSIKGTPEDLQRSLGKLNLVCKAHWEWQTERMVNGTAKR